MISNSRPENCRCPSRLVEIVKGGRKIGNLDTCVEDFIYQQNIFWPADQMLLMAHSKPDDNSYMTCHPF